MADITYTPLGTHGFRLDLAVDGSRMIVERTAEEDEVVVDGDERLISNRSLVQLLAAFGEHEYLSRRARSGEKKKSESKEAERLRGECEGLAELHVRRTDSTRFAWCSSCFEECDHNEVSGTNVPQAYICSSCGAATSVCAAPRCPHNAVRSVRRRTPPPFCAEHCHQIPAFRKLDQRLASLDDYADWLSFESRNAKRMGKKGIGVLSGIAIVTPFAFAAAPAIGGAIGVAKGLSGAAAASHGLAVLGGGSIAAGGFGMAGGTAVVCAVGGALGGRKGAVIASAYADADPSFSIRQMRPGEGPAVIYVKGFLTEGSMDDRGWMSLIDQRFPSAPVYRLHWGSRELKQLAQVVGIAGLQSGAKRRALSMAAKASKAGVGKLGPLGSLMTAVGVATNPFAVASERADMTGVLLADILARTDGDGFVLMGHSLGAKAAVAAATAIGTRNEESPIHEMHLLGAALSGKDWRLLNAGVSGNTWNYWSQNDPVLSKLYRAAKLGKTAVGGGGFNSTYPSIIDRNVSRSVTGHSDYLGAIKLAGTAS